MKCTKNHSKELLRIYIAVDTYLVNLTFPAPIVINRAAEQIYHGLQARYKMLVPDEFLFYSPEPFVAIRNNRISSFPMKGTISGDIPNAEAVILADPKETAEHATIVDLIRAELARSCGVTF